MLPCITKNEREDALSRKYEDTEEDLILTVLYRTEGAGGYERKQADTDLYKQTLGEQEKMQSQTFTKVWAPGLHLNTDC